jgi:hypothetical protein
MNVLVRNSKVLAWFNDPFSSAELVMSRGKMNVNDVNDVLGKVGRRDRFI